MKKLFAIILTLALVLSLCAALVACGGTTPPNFEVPEEGYDGSSVTITFYSSMGQDYDKVFQSYIEDFQELYPNITVVHNRVGGYDDVRNQVRTELANGQSPNVSYCYADHVALYNRSNAVVHLDNLISSDITVTRADGTTEILGLTDEQKADFIEGYYEEGAAFGDDHMYMMPFSRSTELMYFNKDFFTANNLQLPDHWFASDGKQGLETTDTTSMEYVLAKIKEIDPNCTPLGYDSESNWFITLCEQFGTPYTSATGDHYLFNNEQNREMVNTLRRWYQNRWITTSDMINGSYCSTYFVSNSSADGKKCYICIGSSAGASNQRPTANADGTFPFDVGITTIPQAKAGATTAESKVISQGPSVCIYKKDNPQEVVASWLLVKFLTTNANFQAEFAYVGGYTPVIKSAREVDWYKEILDHGNGGTNIAGLAAKTCMDQADAYFASPVFYGSSTARDQVGQLLTTCFLIQNDNANIEKAIEDAFKLAVSECKYAG